MSAGEWLVASAMALLDGNPTLDPLRVFDFAPSRAAFPYAVIEDPVLKAENGAGVIGRVGTFAIQFRDGGEQPRRLRWLVGRLEDAVALLPPDLGGEGWRLAGLALAQSRIARGKDEWLARSVWAVRGFRTN